MIEQRFKFISDVEWPIVEVLYPAKWGDAEWDWTIEYYKDLLSRGGRYGLLVNALESKVIPNSAMRARLADFFRENHGDLAQKLVGLAFIANSTIYRGTITAMNWLHKWPMEYRTFATREQGRQFLLGKLT